MIDDRYIWNTLFIVTGIKKKWEIKLKKHTRQYSVFTDNALSLCENNRNRIVKSRMLEGWAP